MPMIQALCSSIRTVPPKHRWVRSLALQRTVLPIVLVLSSYSNDPPVPPIRDTDQPIIAQENRTTLQEGPDSSTLLM